MSTEIQQQIGNVEHTIETAKKQIKRMEALRRLEDNPDFKEIIMDGFMEDHAIRQVLLRANPSIRSSEQALDAVDLQIAAVGGLKQFFIGIFTMGMEAKDSLEADEATLEELNQELLVSEGS